MVIERVSRSLSASVAIPRRDFVCFIIRESQSRIYPAAMFSTVCATGPRWPWIRYNNEMIKKTKRKPEAVAFLEWAAIRAITISRIII